MHVSLCCVCVSMEAWKEDWDLIALVKVSCTSEYVRSELDHSGRGASALNYWTTSPTLSQNSSTYTVHEHTLVNTAALT